jgi:hypothetical protein
VHRFTSLHANGKQSKLESCTRMGSHGRYPNGMQPVLALCFDVQDMCKQWQGYDGPASTITKCCMARTFGDACHGMVHYCVHFVT